MQKKKEPPPFIIQRANYKLKKIICWSCTSITKIGYLMTKKKKLIVDPTINCLLFIQNLSLFMFVSAGGDAPMAYYPPKFGRPLDPTTDHHLIPKDLKILFKMIIFNLGNPKF